MPQLHHHPPASPPARQSPQPQVPSSATRPPPAGSLPLWPPPQASPVTPDPSAAPLPCSYPPQPRQPRRPRSPPYRTLVPREALHRPQGPARRSISPSNRYSSLQPPQSARARSSQVTLMVPRPSSPAPATAMPLSGRSFPAARPPARPGRTRPPPMPDSQPKSPPPPPPPARQQCHWRQAHHWQRQANSQAERSMARAQCSFRPRCKSPANFHPVQTPLHRSSRQQTGRFCRAESAAPADFAQPIGPQDA
jgi:hypothetical protein